MSVVPKCFIFTEDEDHTTVSKTVKVGSETWVEKPLILLGAHAPGVHPWLTFRMLLTIVVETQSYRSKVQLWLTNLNEPWFQRLISQEITRHRTCDLARFIKEESLLLSWSALPPILAKYNASWYFNHQTSTAATAQVALPPPDKTLCFNSGAHEPK